MASIETLTLTVTNEANSNFRMSIGARNQVCNLAPDGLAVKAGIQMGDTILQLNGSPINGEEELFKMLRALGVKDDATFVLQRKVH